MQAKTEQPLTFSGCAQLARNACTHHEVQGLKHKALGIPSVTESHIDGNRVCRNSQEGHCNHTNTSAALELHMFSGTEQRPILYSRTVQLLQIKSGEHRVMSLMQLWSCSCVTL